MATSTFPRSLAIAVAIAAAAGAAAAAALMAVRIASAVSLVDPMQVPTSGSEEESLYAIWKVVQGLPVYTDRRAVPFNAVVYNWLFYASYGSLVAAVHGVLGLADAWLPTTTHFLTLAGVGVGGFACALLLRPPTDACHGWERPFAAATAVYVVSGPLIGWWGFTARPDAWALALEIAAALWFLRNYPERPWRAVAGAAAACYGAWAFKQTGIVVAGGLTLFLLARWDWRRLLLFGALLSAGFILTFLVAGPDYARNVLFSGFVLEFAWDRGLHNLANMAAKATPALAPLALVAIRTAAHPPLLRPLWHDDTVAFALCGMGVAMAITVPAAFQTGAAESYVFSLSLLMYLGGLAGIRRLARERPLGGIDAAGLILGWGGSLGAIATIALGGAGALDIRARHDALIAEKACLAGLPRPFYVNKPYLALPWMTPGNEPFVVSFQYPVERRSGVAFEAGGVGGLIAAGHFRAIAVLDGGAVLGVETRNGVKTLDGASLADFRPIPTTACAGVRLLMRASPSG